MGGMPTRIHSRFATGMLVSRDAVDQHLAGCRLLQDPGDGQRALGSLASPHAHHDLGSLPRLKHLMIGVRQNGIGAPSRPSGYSVRTCPHMPIA